MIDKQPNSKLITDHSPTSKFTQQMKQYILAIFILVIGISCSKDDSPDSSGDPTNLEVAININEDGSGVVEFVITAENATNYEINTGEPGSEIIGISNGTFSYTYSETGVYLVEIKAFGSSGRFLRIFREITVIVGDQTGPIDGSDGYITPLTYDGMTMIWQDEFNGSALNETYWNYELGTGNNGWGNNELQYYRRENTTVTDGFLIIEARRENFQGRSYTSSRLTTQDKFDFRFGRIDIRAKLPKGQGMWPALWMLGDNFSTVGWPRCGEIDIMEIVGGGEGRDDVTYGTIHWDDNGSTASFGGSTQLTTGIFNDRFYVFTITWNPTRIEWYLNDVRFHSVDITPAELSEFQNEFFFIFNVAVGGNWPGSPNSSTIFPQQMVVDYVRVFQEN